LLCAVALGSAVAAQRASQSPTSTPLVNAPGQAWQERSLSLPAVGRSTAYVPKQPTTHVVLFIGSSGGWKASDVEKARRIAPKAVVIGLSFDALKRAQGAVRCWLPSGVLEDIAKAAEGQLQLPEYRPPSLVGDGAGAALAYASLALAPAGTFSGGVGLGFAPTLSTNRPLCSTRDWKPAFDAAKNTAQLPKVTSTSFNWRDLGKPVAWTAPFDDAIDKVFATPEATTPKAPPPTASAVELERQLAALSLSLDDTWADHPKASLIFISGDGGWRDIDQHVAAYMAPRGVNVIGLSSMSYFWKARTPEQGGADLRRMADILESSKVPIFVGGYSFGADVVPFFLDTWTAADRQKVSGEVLIAASPTATFEINLLALDWVPFHSVTQTPHRVADAIRRIKVPTFCLTGTQVAPADTPCSAVADIATVVKLPGDHHFNGDYDAIGKAALAFIEKQLSR
jgi:type IV secretory pathway VirJ component